MGLYIYIYQADVLHATCFHWWVLFFEAFEMVCFGQLNEREIRTQNVFFSLYVLTCFIMIELMCWNQMDFTSTKFMWALSERAGTNGLKRYSYGNIDMCHIICSPTLESFYLLSCVGVSSKRLPCGWCNLGKGGEGAKLRHCCLLRIRYWLAINKLYSGWDCGQDLCRPVYLHICWELREFQPIMSVAGYLGTILR